MRRLDQVHREELENDQVAAPLDGLRVAKVVSTTMALAGFSHPVWPQLQNLPFGERSL